MSITVPSPLYLRDRIALWVRANRTDLLLLLALTLIAAVPRLLFLGGTPPGLHGDEAIAGLEARSLIDHGTLVSGKLAPYSMGARGVPAGMFYWAVPFIGVLGQNVIAVRLAFAVLGIASVVFTFLAFRIMFSRPIAVIATLLLAVSAWHLLYSRVAFIPIGWPLMQMATLFFFFLALRRNSRWLFAAAGACLGGGIYTYQAFPTFAAGLAIVAVYLAAVQYWRQWRLYTAGIATLLGVALLVGLPMASYAWHNSELYTSRYKEYSVTKTEDYKNADNVFEKARVLVRREREYTTSLISTPISDGVDASGAFPFVDRVTLGLLIAGGAVALWRVRTPAYASVLILIVVIGVGPALAEQGWYRRTLGLTPLLALIGALPLALVWEEGRRRGVWATAIAAVVVVGVFGGVAGINLGRFFGTYDDDTNVRWVYAADLADASQFMNDLPGGTYIYFYNSRHSLNYETRQYIAPHVHGEDRSTEFGGTASLLPDRTKDLAYIFMGSYIDQLSEVMRLYPGGTERVVMNKKDGSTIYEAYLLPHVPGAVPPPPEEGQPTPTPHVEAGGDQRDATRQRDLDAVAAALEQYHQTKGSYPDTGGGVQSLCVYPGLDAGCELGLSPLPQDPLGDAGRNGYFYVSDGPTYVLYAQRESEVLPACDDHPEHLGQFASLLCVKGPPP